MNPSGKGFDRRISLTIFIPSDTPLAFCWIKRDIGGTEQRNWLYYVSFVMDSVAQSSLNETTWVLLAEILLNQLHPWIPFLKPLNEHQIEN